MNKDKVTLWRKRISDKKTSGLKLNEWCTKNQLSKYAYYYWSRLIAELDNNTPDKQLFVEVPNCSVGTYDVMPGVLLIEWNEISIKATDSNAVTLAAELITKLHKLC